MEAVAVARLDIDVGHQGAVSLPLEEPLLHVAAVDLRIAESTTQITHLRGESASTNKGQSRSEHPSSHAIGVVNARSHAIPETQAVEISQPLNEGVPLFLCFDLAGNEPFE